MAHAAGLPQVLSSCLALDFRQTLEHRHFSDVFDPG
jgi:hypothetical protein